MNNKRRTALKLIVGTCLLPLTSCQENTVVDYKDILKSIDTTLLHGVLILSKFKVKSNDIESYQLDELLELLKIWHKSDIASLVSTNIGQKIKNDFLENKTIKKKDFIFSQTEYVLYNLFKKHKVSI